MDEKNDNLENNPAVQSDIDRIVEESSKTEGRLSEKKESKNYQEQISEGPRNEIQKNREDDDGVKTLIVILIVLILLFLITLAACLWGSK